jgi:hypothetical protein
MGKFDPYVPRARGRLPFKYELHDEWSTKTKLRVLAGLMALGAVIYGAIYAVLR